MQNRHNANKIRSLWTTILSPLVLCVVKRRVNNSHPPEQLLQMIQKQKLQFRIKQKGKQKKRAINWQREEQKLWTHVTGVSP